MLTERDEDLVLIFVMDCEDERVTFAVGDTLFAVEDTDATRDFDFEISSVNVSLDEVSIVASRVGLNIEGDGVLPEGDSVCDGVCSLENLGMREMVSVVELRTVGDEMLDGVLLLLMDCCDDRVSVLDSTSELVSVRLTSCCDNEREIVVVKIDDCVSVAVVDCDPRVRLASVEFVTLTVSVTVALQLESPVDDGLIDEVSLRLSVGDAELSLLCDCAVTVVERVSLMVNVIVGSGDADTGGIVIVYDALMVTL